MLDETYPTVKRGPPTPSRIIEPRVFSMPMGTERYVVEGLGAIFIVLEVGDQIKITNDEGGQLCELIATDPKGKIDADVIGEKGTGPAGGLHKLLVSDDRSLRGLRMSLEARGIDLSKSGAIHLFETTSPAKTEASFRATRDGAVIIAAPSDPMDVALQNTATPLTVMVKRAVIKSAIKFEAPEPLVDPLADIRVHTQTAESFFCKSR